MAAVSIELSVSRNGISWSPGEPAASEGDTVQFSCADGPWMIAFKKENSPLGQSKLHGPKGPNGRKGSKVKVKVKKKTRFWYSVAVWDAQNGRVWLVDPPLDIVPRSGTG